MTHGLIGDVVYGIICQQKLPPSAGGGVSQRELGHPEERALLTSISTLAVSLRVYFEIELSLVVLDTRLLRGILRPFPFHAQNLAQNLAQARLGWSTPQFLAPVVFPGYPCSAGERGTESSRGVFSGSLHRRSHRTSSSLTPHDCLPRAKPQEKSVESNSQTQIPSPPLSDTASVSAAPALISQVRKLSSRTGFLPRMRLTWTTSSPSNLNLTTTPPRITLLRTRRQLSRVRPSPFLPVSTMGHA